MGGVKTKLSRGAIAAIAALLAAGLAMVIVGWVIQGSDYWPSLLLQIGSTLLLFAPLVALERLLQQQIGETRQEVKDVRREVEATNVRLDDLGAETKERIQKARVEDEERIQAAREDVSFDKIRELLRRAESLDAIDPDGVRVGLPTYERLRFKPAIMMAPMTGGPGSGDEQPIVWISLEALDGARIDAIAVWTADQSSVDLMAAVAEKLQTLGRYRGDAAFDATEIFEALIGTLETAIEGKTGGYRGEPLSPVIEVPNEDWAITTFGLERIVEPDYTIDADRLVDEADDWRRHMREKTWLEGRWDQFAEAFDVALAYHRRQRKQATK